VGFLSGEEQPALVSHAEPDDERKGEHGDGGSDPANAASAAG